jgi:hypothetical protein
MGKEMLYISNSSKYLKAMAGGESKKRRSSVIKLSGE